MLILKFSAYEFAAAYVDRNYLTTLGEQLFIPNILCYKIATDPGV